MEDLQVGVVGIGNIGSAHAKSIFSGKVEGMHLAAVCDTDDAKRAWAQEQFPGVPVFDTFDQLPSSGISDIVVIAAPHYGHASLTVSAFQHGLNVLTEKPISVCTNDAKKMIAAAKASGKAFGIMFKI